MSRNRPRTTAAPTTPAAPAAPPAGYVTVGQLRTLLQDLEDDRVVVLAADAEGNRYSPLQPLLAATTYRADSTWNGELLTDPEVRALADLELPPWRRPLAAVVLYPVR